MFLSLAVEGKSRSTSPKTVSPRNKEDMIDITYEGDKNRSFLEPSPSIKHNFTTAPSPTSLKLEPSGTAPITADTESSELKLSVQSSEDDDDSNERNLLTVKVRNLQHPPN